jgi:hypothetical protein
VDAFFVRDMVETVPGHPRRRRVTGLAERTKVYPAFKVAKEKKVADDVELAVKETDLAAVLRAGFDSLAAQAAPRQPRPRQASASTRGRKLSDLPKRVLAEVDPASDDSDGSWQADDAATKGELSAPPKQPEGEEPPKPGKVVRWAKLLVPEPMLEPPVLEAVGDAHGEGLRDPAAGAPAAAGDPAAGAPAAGASAAAADDLPAVPAPPAEPRRPRLRRGVAFGPFAIATVSLHGEIIGYGATCGRHLNARDKPGTQCKIQLPFGKVNPLSHAECRARVKEWCLRGLGIPAGDPAARDIHLSFRPRDLDLPHSEAEMEAMVDGLVAAADGAA